MENGLRSGSLLREFSSTPLPSLSPSPSPPILSSDSLVLPGRTSLHVLDEECGRMSEQGLFPSPRECPCPICGVDERMSRAVSESHVHDLSLVGRNHGDRQRQKQKNSRCGSDQVLLDTCSYFDPRLTALLGTRAYCVWGEHDFAPPGSPKYPVRFRCTRREFQIRNRGDSPWVLRGGKCGEVVRKPRLLGGGF